LDERFDRFKPPLGLRNWNDSFDPKSDKSGNERGY
jgi:hypothetical protein